MATEDVSKKASARNVAVERRNLITVCRSVRLARERNRGSGIVFRHKPGSCRPFVLLLLFIYCFGRFVGLVSEGLLFCV